MTSSWHRSKRLFLDAIDRPKELQGEYVRAHAIDVEMEQEVLRMLEQHHAEDGMLESPITKPGESIPTLAGLSRAIPGYTIRDILGRGGMGTVYLATQHQPCRSVAIKLMRSDITDQASRQRFENEIELLAKLQHPGIARIYQSGMAEFDAESRPWFSMEHITGITLAEYLGAEGDSSSVLRLEEKVALLQQIIRAVAFAHQQGVVHRDLKPGNVLVQTQSPEYEPDMPRIKIVDFGIAKLHAQSPRCQLTLTQDLIGTLNYMSPEAIAGSHPRLDHRVDVYALGVIAFEALTGTLPHDRQSSSIVSTVKNIEYEVPRRIRDVDPSLPKDLELVIAKAMATDTRVRYATAEDFLLDLQRFLDARPVLARRPSLRYRIGRYLRRNRVVAAATLVVVLSLSSGLIASIYSARQARLAAAASSYEAEKANAVNSFFTNDLLGRLLQRGIDDESNQSLKQTVDGLAMQVDMMYSERPLILAAIRNELGSIYYSMQDFSNAEDQFRRARHAWESELGVRHPDTLKAISNLGQSQLALGPSEETELLLRQAYQLRSEVLGFADESTQRSLNNLGEFLRQQDRLEEAEQLFCDGLERQTESLGRGHKTTLTTAVNLGSLYVTRGKLKEALSLHESSYRSASRTLGVTHPLTMQIGIRWIQTLDQAGNHDRAERELLPMMDIYRETTGSPGALIIPYRLMARIHRHQKRYEVARTQLLLAKELAEQLNDVRNLTRIERDLDRVSTGLSRE
ncbi:MAG: serine/threonine-protein kinase [Planctomycetota bacterium]